MLTVVFGMLGVSNCIKDDVLQKYLQKATSFLVDQCRDSSLFTSSPSQSTNSRRSNSLDVITKNFAMTLNHLPLPRPHVLNCIDNDTAIKRHFVCSVDGGHVIFYVF